MRGTSTRTGRSVVAFAAAIRLLVVIWGTRFPPAADGTYYDTLAHRIADGAGYTWLWPDGAVTPVAHYPVGYPALISFGYRVFGPSPVAAMAFAGLLGTFAVAAAYRLLTPSGARVATIGAFLLAIHPALLLYIPAFMTEGITTSLLVIAAAVADAARSERGSRRALWLRAGLGLLLAALVYLRPQNLLLVPFFAFLAAWSPDSSASPDRARALLRFATPLLVAALCIAPWTARNCVQMKKCALVSVNGGWNLLIGAETTSGAWQALQTPEECRTVWSEAEKDACFDRAARREILADPVAWIRRAPAKLGVTFDYFGAAPWYLHESAPRVIGDAGKKRLAIMETAFSRVMLLVALWAVARARGRFPRTRIALAIVGAPFACMMHATLAYLALAGACALLAIGAATAAATSVMFVTAVVVALTALVHLVFFGAGRYGLPVAAFVPLIAASAFASRRISPADARESVAQTASIA